jgi:hypothetical protein
VPFSNICSSPRPQLPLRHHMLPDTVCGPAIPNRAATSSVIFSADPEANYLSNSPCVVLALVFLRLLCHYTSSNFLFVEVPAERCRWLSFNSSLHPSLRKRRQPQSTARHGVDCGTFSIWQSIPEDSSERWPSLLEPVILTS